MSDLPFSVGKPVPMQSVPQPAAKNEPSKYAALYEQVSDCKRETALPVTFPDERVMGACRTALRKIAKNTGDFISSSREADALTVYFWIEPKEVADELRRLKGLTNRTQ